MKKRFWMPALTVMILGAIHTGCSNNGGPSSPSGNNSPNPPTFTPTVTDTFTQACFVGASPSCTPTATATSTNTATPTDTFTFTDTSTKTFTPTQTFTNTVTSTATPSSTKTPSSTPTDTPTVTPSNTPSSTATKTPTSTPSNTATMSPTNSATNSPTNSATNTPTNTPTNTFTFTPTGSTTATYTPTAHYTQVSSISVPGGSPEGLAVTITAGVTYIYVSNLSSIIQYTANLGSSWTTIGTSGSGTGQFTTPNHLALDGAGNLYAADGGNARAQRRNNSSGTWTVLTGNTYAPFGVGTDGSNNAYESETNGTTVAIIRKLPSGGTNFGTSLSYYAGAYNPQGVCTDSAGNVYVVDGSAYNVYKYNGSSWGTFFGTGYPGGSAVSQLFNPHAAAWYSGNLFVADAGNHRVMELSAPTTASTGTYVLQFSAGNDPLAIAVDANGTIYVADYTTNSIYIFTYVP